MNNRTLCIVIATITFLSIPPSCRGEEFRFDSADELNRFLINGNVQFVAGSGISDGGAVQPEEIVGVTPNTSSFIWHETPFGFDDANDNIRMSLMFQLDLSDDSTIASNTTMTVASLRLYSDLIPSTYQTAILSVDFYMSRVGLDPIKTTIGVSSTSNGSGTGRTFPIVNPLSDDHWYRLSGNLILAPGEDHNLFEYKLDDFGPTGSGHVQQVTAGFVDGSQATQMFSKMKLFRDSNVYAGFMVSRHANVGAAFADSFTVMPEPTSLGLIALGLLASVLLRYR